VVGAVLGDGELACLRAWAGGLQGVLPVGSGPPVDHFRGAVLVRFARRQDGFWPVIDWMHAWNLPDWTLPVQWLLLANTQPSPRGRDPENSFAFEAGAVKQHLTGLSPLPPGPVGTGQRQKNA